MKKFVFRLESVLTLRAREEQTAQQHYAHSLSICQSISQQLTEAQSDMEGYHLALTQARSGTSNRQLQLTYLQALQDQQKRCAGLNHKLTKSKREVALRLEAMLDTRRRREALSHLKAKQQAAHQTANARAEELAIGDLITSRYARQITEVSA
ncbi:MAG: flagellar export protein FliJ [Verrucomicrobia bacterium]|nr:flagellar export protein FliJ [Verrucomicrobiota bacterium]